MKDAGIDLLTGTVRIPIDAPEHWADDGLYEFYEDPNYAKWGREICRVLYHETLHFWQFLGWSFVATVIDDQWQRLLTYENTGNLNPPSTIAKAYNLALDELPFSARDLIECHARYWDMHTRGPDTIIYDEALNVPRNLTLRGANGYTSEAYDFVMCAPKNSDYEIPYQWMLNRANGDSKLVAVTFPLLMHVMFGGENSVQRFCEIFEYVVDNREWIEFVHESRGSINYNWMDCWGAFRHLIINPLFESHIRVASGFEQIEHGSLNAHPTFQDYLFRMGLLKNRMDMHFAILQDRITQRLQSSNSPRFEYSPSEKELITSINLPQKYGIGVLFGLPGHPDYRLELGWLLPPPRVIFKNIIVYAGPPKNEGNLPLYGVSILKTSEELKAEYTSLDKRVERFKNAIYAVEKGWPPDFFESAT